jgi:hypothetical protein
MQQTNIPKEIQTNKLHYEWNKYVYLGRFCSYWHQIDEIDKLRPKSVLVIGIGDNIVVNILKNMNYEVATLDIEETLNPDYCGSILNLKEILGEKQFDTIVCCQVLEHLPFSSFDKCIELMCAYSKSILLSLPYNALNLFDVSIRNSFIKEISFNISIPKFWINFDIHKHGNNEHYWEIGCKKTSLRNIYAHINKYVPISKALKAKENTYHYFFVLKKT